MDDNKTGLYIVAIVGVIAVVALVVLVLGAGRGERTAYPGTSTISADDAAGQVIRASAHCSTHKGDEAGCRNCPETCFYAPNTGACSS